MSGGLGSLLGILAVSSLNQWVSPEIDLPFLVGSFGASAVLIFAVVESKLSQPRSVRTDLLLWAALLWIGSRHSHTRASAACSSWAARFCAPSSGCSCAS